MSSINSFLRPVVAAFIVCLLLSWAGAEFKSAARLKTAQGGAPPSNVQNVVDATPPAVLAATVTAAQIIPTPNEVADSSPDDSVMSLLVAPRPAPVVNAVSSTSASRAISISLQGTSLRKTRLVKQQKPAAKIVIPAGNSSAGSAPPVQTPINPPSLPGPTSVSSVHQPIPKPSQPSVIDQLNKFAVAVDLELPTVADAPSGAAVERIVGEGGDNGGLAAASFAGSASALETAVPEPGTLGLLGLGFGGWLLARRRRMRNVEIQ